MPEIGRLKWYAGRAAKMSPREMAWRTGRLAATLAHRDERYGQPDARILGTTKPVWNRLLWQFRCGFGRPVLLDEDRARCVAGQEPRAVAALIDEADKLLAGQRSYFGYPTARIGAAVDWNHDPISDHRWPMIASSRIDHRVAPSDPKWIWELNRLQHLPVLAQAWLFTGDPRYAEKACDDLDSWLDQNPVGTGIAWRGAFEAGVRAISVAVAVQGLRNSPAMSEQLYRRVARMLDATARYCWSGRSRFSSANNHLIGELAGLVTVHLLFPELVGPASRYARAVNTLAAEADRLIQPDGSGAEQSISYQIFTAELLSVVAVLMELGGEQAPQSLIAALDRSARYIVSVMGSDDPDFRNGDDDDGFALRLGAEHKRTVREHLGIVAAVTGRADAARYGRSTLTAAWVADALGTDLADIGAGVGRGEPIGSSYAPNGGLVVLRDGARRITADVGPLGYLSIAAHGHADALAITLSDRGEELIVDPGAGSYYGNPAWRSVFRGTRAHATVCVDGVDQSEIGGPFYWTRHAVATVRSVDLDRGVVDAEHDGYRRLDDPVTHRRWVVARPGDATIVVVDLLDGRSEHDVTVSWPLHPSLNVSCIGDGHLVTRSDEPVLQLCYAATAPVRVDAMRGDTRSHLGWWSDRLEARVPAWLVAAHCRTALPLAVVTVLRTADAGVIGTPDIELNGDEIAVSWSEHKVRRGLTIDVTGSGAVVSDSILCPVELVSE